MLTYHIEANTLDQLRKQAIIDLGIAATSLDPQIELPLTPPADPKPVKAKGEVGRPRGPKHREPEVAPAVAPAPQADNAAPQAQVGNSASAPTESSPAVEGANGTGSDDIATEAGPSESVAPTFDDMKTAMKELNDKKGLDAPGAVLVKFGFQKLRHVTPDKFADVIAAAQQALAS